MVYPAVLHPEASPGKAKGGTCALCCFADELLREIGFIVCGTDPLQVWTVKGQVTGAGRMLMGTEEQCAVERVPRHLLEMPAVISCQNRDQS